MLNLLARMLPYTWMAHGFRLVTIKELGAWEITATLSAMSVMAAASLLAALACAKRKNAPVEHGLAVNSGPDYPRKG
ncbi:MAG: hypothetical protein ACPLTR_06120 [Thermacetogeniaceae bacterium]